MTLRDEKEPSEEARKERARHMFEYLKLLAERRSKPIADLANYEECLWLRDIPGERESATLLTNPANEAILSVKRIATPARPPLPTECEGWIKESALDNYEGDPQLDARRTTWSTVDGGEEEIEVTENLSEHPDVTEAWREYQDGWATWALEMMRAADVNRVYSKLYAMHSKAAAQPEMLECVLGVGHLAWLQTGKRVCRHLLSLTVDLELDPRSATITAKPHASSLVSLEEDMVEIQNRPDPNLLKERFENIEYATEQILTAPEVHEFLEAWVNACNDKGGYSRALLAGPPGQNPEVTFAPALLVRKRGQKSLIHAYNNILDQLERLESTPENIIDLIETRDNTHAESSEEAAARTQTDYFPLPANDEQRDILRQLGCSRGVVVQGPPGTGKSHTIINLISHLLADGKRVLVTSHADQALEVLRDKMPEGLRDLCVSVIGDGKAGAKDLENSLNAIDGRSNGDWRKEFTRQIEEIEQKIVDETANRTTHLAMARRLRLSQIEPCGYGDYRLQPSRAAELLNEDKAVHGWLPEDTIQLPCSHAEAVNLLRILRSFSALDRLQRPRRTPIGPITPEDFEKLAAEVNAARKAKANPPPGAEFWTTRTEEQRKQVRGATVAFEEALSELHNFNAPWSNGLLQERIAGRHDHYDLLKVTTESALQTLRKYPDADRVPFGYARQEQPTLLLSQANSLLVALQAGQKLKTMGVKTQASKNAQDLLECVRVAGRAPESIPALEQAIQVLALHADITPAAQAWGPTINLNGPFGLQAQTLAYHKAILDSIDQAYLRALDLAKILRMLAAPAVSIFNDEGRTAIKNGISYAGSLDGIRELETRLTEARTPWAVIASTRTGTPESADAVKAMEGLNPASYAAAFEAHTERLELNKKIQLRDSLIEKVAAASRTLASQISDTADDPAWLNRLSEIERAWDWKQTNDMFKKMSEENDMNAASYQLGRSETNLLALKAQLGQALAWKAALGRLNAKQMQHLRAYQSAVKRMGKTETKTRARELANARRHMDEAQHAVPAWIMPIYRVADSISPAPGSFDVIIVDEASQAGVESLFLMWLGKKMVIVGDDKQVGPSDVGSKADDIEVLQTRYLSDVPLRDVFGLKSSLFDQATHRYQGRIMLTEHFRCMPEIINFSNALMYDYKLQPLRQYGESRLKPLRSVYVEGAETTSTGQHKTNEQEAEAIAQTVAACVESVEYDGKSMGVISLLGPKQAQLIEQKLLDRLGPQVLVERKLRCGDAPAFQGDERDIIFLSMVVAPSETRSRIPALGDYFYKQRFNVAASRAKDQMWLFHSVELSNLNPECPRAQLLSHFQNPPVVGLKPFSGPVTRNERCDPFDSLFEQRVYLDLKERGYQVVPQWEALGRRIDLVVVGDTSRLAVECDGDFWHGPEKYEEDLARERDLERVGWSFFRIRGSDYHRDPGRALEPLWLELESRGIRPQSGEVDKTVFSSRSVFTPIATPADSSESEMQTEAEGESGSEKLQIVVPHSQGEVEELVQDKAEPRDAIAAPIPLKVKEMLKPIVTSVRGGQQEFEPTSAPAGAMGADRESRRTSVEVSGTVQEEAPDGEQVEAEPKAKPEQVAKPTLSPVAKTTPKKAEGESVLTQEFLDYVNSIENSEQRHYTLQYGLWIKGEIPSKPTSSKRWAGLAKLQAEWLLGRT